MSADTNEELQWTVGGNEVYGWKVSRLISLDRMAREEYMDGDIIKHWEPHLRDEADAFCKRLNRKGRTSPYS